MIKENIKLLKELDNSIQINLSFNKKNIILNSDKEQLNRVFFNLIKNSIESIQQKLEKNVNIAKKIDIELLDHNDHINISIIDTGIGFDNLASDIKNILKPYFTTKKNGTGLGLSIVNKIINDHNGSIEFNPIKNGASIKIVLLKLWVQKF